MTRKILWWLNVGLLIMFLVLTALSFRSGLWLSIRYNRGISSEGSQTELSFSELATISRFGAARFVWTSPRTVQTTNHRFEEGTVTFNHSMNLESDYPYYKFDPRRKQIDQGFNEWKLWGFQYVSKKELKVRAGNKINSSDLMFRSFTFPYWPLVLLWVAFVFLFFLKRRKRNFRARNGMCLKCGYSLGTTEVCPECGRSKSD